MNFEYESPYIKVDGRSFSNMKESHILYLISNGLYGEKFSFLRCSSHRGYTSHIVFEDVNFEACFLNEGVFERCEFIRCNFKYSYLQNVKFQNCKFLECDMSNARINSTFEECLFHGTDLRYSDITGAYLVNEYSDSNLNKTRLTGAIIQNSRMSLGVKSPSLFFETLFDSSNFDKETSIRTLTYDYKEAVK